MAKIVVGPVNKGLRTDVLPFNVDNDSFPVLTNAYQWRGRVKRKRGTSPLGRLTRVIFTQSIGLSGATPWTFNLYSSLTPPIVPEVNASIVPGSVQIFFAPVAQTGLINAPGYTNATDAEVFSTSHGLSTGDLVFISGVVVVPGSGPNNINGGPYKIEANSLNSFKLAVSSQTWGVWQSGGTWSHTTGSTIVFLDQGNATLTSVTPGNSGTINYLTGSVTLIHTGGVGAAVSATFSYYPNLPVMGLEDLVLSERQFPGTLAFDTVYAYDISTLFPFDIHNVNFYKNPPTNAYPGYTQKTDDTEFTWNGEDYQQFHTVNYQGALWATNGIKIPFNIEKIGMQYRLISPGSVARNGVSTTTATFNIAAHGLVVGDFIFVNEVPITAGNITGINFQTGYVTTRTDANNFIATFPNATIGGVTSSSGIVQYLTNRSDITKDCIRWYDGDPRISNNGWVNFCPPLSEFIYSIADLPQDKYYLVGARLIVPYKDRLLFFGPVVQTSAAGSQVYLQDTVIFSQNGTPYYTASYTNSPSATVDTPTNPPVTPPGFVPILLPVNQTSTPSTWFEDQTGFGGFLTAGVDQQINTVSTNEDVLIVGFTRLQTRLVYTGNDALPFNFFSINSEFGSGSTFSTINMDKGVLTIGSRGFIMTSQTGASRFDLLNPDLVYQIRRDQHGTERVTAIRDFIDEWIYFTYPFDQDTHKFPNQTLFYNYRNESWGTFNESYTRYGLFRKTSGLTWATAGSVYKTWSGWSSPWNSGSSSLSEPLVIAGNQQGFVVVREEDSINETSSLYIQAISGNVLTSPDHCLNNGDYITVSGVLGTLSTQMNGKIFSVFNITQNTFSLNPVLTSGTYLGGGLITRMYVPLMQTKQFPLGWDLGRKTRIGVQQYLLSSTPNAQITLLLFLSQNAASAYNEGPIVPEIGSVNNSLIYSTVLYTCPESTNLGLTPANTNLLQNTKIDPSGSSANPQQQIWHRCSTSLIGDTVQLGFTLSDTQMRTVNVEGQPISQFEEIELHGFIIEATPSSLLA